MVKRHRVKTHYRNIGGKQVRVKSHMRGRGRSHAKPHTSVSKLDGWVADVRRVYTESTRDLDWRSEPIYYNSATAPYIERALYLDNHPRYPGQYNEYDAAQVFPVLENLHQKGLLKSIIVGREGSPVIYIGVQHFIGHAEMNRLRKALVADEINDVTDWDRKGGVKAPGNRTIRIWWD